MTHLNFKLKGSRDPFLPQLFLLADHRNGINRLIVIDRSVRIDLLMDHK